MFRLLPALLLALMVSPAWSKDKKDKDDDDDLLEEDRTPNASDFKDKDEDEEEDDKTPKPPPPADEKQDDKGGDDLDFTDPGDQENLEFNPEEEEEQQTIQPRGPGEDTAQIYRKAETEYREMSPEEELIAWDRYLQKYPKSLFRERIESRVEDVSATLYNDRVPGSDRGARTEQAAKRELNFFTPVHMASADTRQKILVQAGWGYPNWVTFQLDYEHAFFREFSVHAGLMRDLPGVALSLGPKYAILKSARTGTILTGSLDFKFNTLPGFVGLRPSISFGQRINVMSGLDLQAQFGTDLEARDPFGVRWFWGLGGELHPNKVVSVFVESDINMKYLAGEQAPSFSFMTGVFGLKFTPRAGNKDGHGRVEAGLAADAPYAYKYWGFYRGGVDLMGAYYF